jgi:hypothetical protein
MLNISYKHCSVYSKQHHIVYMVGNNNTESTRNHKHGEKI